jgi:hypothetical protein
MNMRKLEIIALLFLGTGLLLWGMDRQPAQLVHVREQGRMALSELRAGSVHERVADPVHLFRASLAEFQWPLRAPGRTPVAFPGSLRRDGSS